MVLDAYGIFPPHTPPPLVDGLPGCGLEAADPLVGDELGRMVTWRGRSDLSALAGREVSVRLLRKDGTQAPISFSAVSKGNSWFWFARKLPSDFAVPLRG